MAKSQTTSSKKENEKKRQSRRKDKEQRREDRKANSNKGKSFEDMIAYVDENGRITSTPPDLHKKKTIKAEDIQIGTARQLPTEPGEAIRKGTVTFFNDSKGYGFIKDLDSQDSVFVHANALSNPIKEGDRVIFEIEMGHKGPNAVRVSLAEKTPQ